jgi:TRAP-type uncharacterized transport system fused permease subunit
MIPVTISLAAAGIVIGVFGLTGLGMRFSAMLLSIAGGNMLVLLLLAMLAAILFGMGMPTTPAYLFLAILVAPAVVTMGIPPMHAHLFIMYYAILSVVTPPVAVAAFAVAPLAGVSPWKAGFRAFRICLGGLLLPYMWIYGPLLVGSGDALAVTLGITKAILGLTAVAAAIEGYFVRRTSVVERIILGVAAIFCVPGTLMYTVGGIGLINVAGVGLIVLVGVYQWLTREKPVKTPA